MYKKTFCFAVVTVLSLSCRWASGGLLGTASTPTLLLPGPDSVVHRTCTAGSCVSFTDSEGLVEELKEQRHFYSLSFNRPGSILVGAMDTAYVLSTDLELIYKIDMTSENKSQCLDIISSLTVLGNLEEYRCHNHIRHFDVLPGRDPPTLFLCGTDAFFGACAFVEDNQLHENMIIDGRKHAISPLSVGVMPTDPALFYNGQLLMNSSGLQPMLVSALTVASTSNDGVVTFQSLGVDPSDSAPQINTLMRTEKSRDITNPQLMVDVFAHDFTNPQEPPGAQDYVFVVFQESYTPDEMPELPAQWESRIARVCKNDAGSLTPGVPLVRGGQGVPFFNTFVKASIYCTVPVISSIKSLYNTKVFTRIFDFELVDRSRFAAGEDVARIGYGLFAESGISPKSSALCVYSAERSNASRSNNNGFFDIFMRQFVGDIANDLTGCADGGISRRANNGFMNNEISNDIQQLEGGPLFVLPGVALLKLQVDPMQPVIRGGSLDYQDVIFVASDEGKIYKIFISNSTRQPVVSDEITLDGSSLNRMVIQEVNSVKYLFATTNSSVYKLPLQDCSRYQFSCCSCVQARDPYCGFNTELNRCVPITSTTDPNAVIQDVDGVSSVDALCNAECSTTSNVGGVSGNTTDDPTGSPSTIIGLSVVTVSFIVACLCLMIVLVVMVMVWRRSLKGSAAFAGSNSHHQNGHKSRSMGRENSAYDSDSCVVTKMGSNCDLQVKINPTMATEKV